MSTIMKKNKYRRLPNGFGTISHLSGKRRKPYVAKAPAVYIIDEDNQTGKYSRLIIGSAETWEKAYQLLLKYNETPYNLSKKNTTLKQVYDAWSKEHFEIVSDSSEKGYKAAFSILENYYDKPFCKLRAFDFENAAKESGKNAPTLKRYKTLINMLYKYAIKYEITTVDFSQAVDLSSLRNRNPNKKKKNIFTKKEIDTLWKSKDKRTVQIILIMIYSGVRIEELLSLTKEDVFLDRQVFEIGDSKTENGIRTVPIADKMLPFFKQFMKEKGKTNHLILNARGTKFGYHNFRKNYWNPTMEELGMNHRPHETRHTCASLLADHKIEPRTIKKILGHSGAMDLTEKVYTHLDDKVLLDAINTL